MTIPVGLNRGRQWIRGAANAPEWMGIYELSKQRALRRLVSSGTTVCDIGANAGFYSLALSRLVGEAGRVLAFEPLPRNAEKIRRHLTLNRVQNVALHPCALSDVNGVVRFAEGENDFTGRISEDNGGFEVQSIRLDDFLSDQAGDDPALLKIDVEGAEARVLIGAEMVIARARPTVLLALHGAQQRRQCFDILRSYDYRIASLDNAAITTPAEMPDEIVALPANADF